MYVHAFICIYGCIYSSLPPPCLGTSVYLYIFICIYIFIRITTTTISMHSYVFMYLYTYHRHHLPHRNLETTLAVTQNFAHPHSLSKVSAALHEADAKVGLGVVELHKRSACLFIMIPWTKSSLFALNAPTLTVFFLLKPLHFMVYLTRSTDASQAARRWRRNLGKR
ncbi:hypothetical protein B484DRAFT_244783 [Ochromonadaceae sp. CCMP2298]|nr:hypothetical protein B484DRAFT_244783 [Ochromonadaceae sp. CCMP2298]